MADPYPCLVAALIAGWRIGEPERYKMRPVYQPDGTLRFRGRTEAGILFHINRFQNRKDNREKVLAS